MEAQVIAAVVQGVSTIVAAMIGAGSVFFTAKMLSNWRVRLKPITQLKAS